MSVLRYESAPKCAASEALVNGKEPRAGQTPKCQVPRTHYEDGRYSICHVTLGSPEDYGNCARREKLLACLVARFALCPDAREFTVDSAHGCGALCVSKDGTESSTCNFEATVAVDIDGGTSLERHYQDEEHGCGMQRAKPTMITVNLPLYDIQA